MARVRHTRAGRGLSTGVREIPLARPLLDEREEELVLEVLRSGRLSLGPTIDRFEELLANRIGAPYVAAVSSGTAGLHLLARSAGLGPGDQAITSPISFASSANCFIFEGAEPVFADVDPRTLNLDPAALEAAITERTKAVVAVDMFGYPCELDTIRAICDRHGLALIEDAAEALGAEYRGAPIGSHGPSGVFGFYPNKQLATGEGGVVFTHSEEEWQLVRSLRNQGRDYAGGAWFHHVRLGFNYRWTDVQAAIGIGQLEKLDRLLAMRSEVAERYARMLDGVEVEQLRADDADHRRSWFVYVVALPQGVDRDRVIEELRGQGIGTADYVPCVHLQPYMRERYGFAEGMCPVAEEVASRTLALPFYPQLEAEDQERVVEALRGAL
jgi:perosamine synthetase